MSRSPGKPMSCFIVSRTVRNLALSSLLLAWSGGFFCVQSLRASDWDEETPGSKSKDARPANRTKAPAGEAENKVPEPTAAGENQTKPLSGRVEKEGTVPSFSQKQNSNSLSSQKNLAGQKDLTGAVSDSGLQGYADKNQLSRLTPQKDSAVDTLQGKIELLGGKTARSSDPDQDDVELMVEWDRWHNRFLRAVQLGTQEMLNNPDPEEMERLRLDPGSGHLTSRYPLGIGCAFSCIVTAGREIKNAEIIEPSGYARYDRAVLRAVRQLSETQILNFPRGSHRLTVLQPGRIKTSNSNDFKYYHFGDVEHVRPRE